MKILEHWVDYNQCEPFSLVMDYEVFLISLILRSSCNKHCKLQNMSHGEKRRKKKVKIKNQKIETDRDIWH